jgi:3-deoxy-7-phosphoheptulonate synthase
VHPAPEKAISDGAQSLDIPQFQKMMKELEPYIELWKASRPKEAAATAV